MGGDRRSPPHHRSKGGGGGKVKGISVLPRCRDSKGRFTGLKGEKIDKTVKSDDIPISTSVLNRNDNPYEQDCRLEEEFSGSMENRDFLNQEDVEGEDAQGPNFSKPPLVCAINSFSELSENDSQICNFKTSNSIIKNQAGMISESEQNSTDIRVGSDGRANSIVEDKIKKLDSLLKNDLDEISSGRDLYWDIEPQICLDLVRENETSGRMFSDEALDKSFMNCDQICDHMENNIPDSNDVTLAMDNNNNNFEADGEFRRQTYSVQEEGSKPVLLTDGRKDSDHSAINHAMKLPTGMILNVLNPMFIKDNENTRLDGDCEMMLIGEEEFCIKQNSENQVNMAADTYVSNGSCTEGVREVGCERFQNRNGRSIDNGASGNDYPREVGNKESNLRKINERTNATNAWKRPVHVQVDWQNQGKASTDGKFVNLNIENVNSNQSKLEKALVGKLIGRRLPFHILSSELQKRWLPYGEFKCLLTGEESFICIFNSAEARDAILMGGPWLIGGYVIGLDKWSPDYTHDSICGLTAPVWIRFPKLPLLYWDNDNLARIASMVGQPLWIDAVTSELGRCAFARVCVRLDFGLKLPTGVWIPGINGNFFQKVEYEGINQVCFSCGHIGHKVESCALSKKTNVVETIPLSRDKATVGWQKGNQGVHKMQVEEGSISKAEQVSSKFNTNIPMEVGECSKSGAQPVDRDWRYNTSEDDEDAVYGPWIYVTRKNNKFKNGKAKFAAVKQDKLKENNGPPMGRENLANNIDKGKRIYHSDKESLTQDKVNAGSDVGIFTATRISVNRFGTDFTNLEPVEPAVVFSATRRVENLTAGSSRNRSCKERESNRVPSAKEINNLGSIATGSRNRRKEAADCGDLLDFQVCVDKVADGHERLLLEDTSKCGGDASPQVN